MSFITFILACGLLKVRPRVYMCVLGRGGGSGLLIIAALEEVRFWGRSQGMHQKFNPEVLVNATSAGLVTSIIEVAVIRLGLYVSSTEGCSIVRYAYQGKCAGALTVTTFSALSRPISSVSRGTSTFTWYSALSRASAWD